MTRDRHGHRVRKKELTMYTNQRLDGFESRCVHDFGEDGLCKFCGKSPAPAAGEGDH